MCHFFSSYLHIHNELLIGQETTGQETELDNIGQHNGIAIISGTNSLPKYEDLPPSYEDVIHGRVNLSFIKEEASPIQTTTSEHVNNPNS